MRQINNKSKLVFLMAGASAMLLAASCATPTASTPAATQPTASASTPSPIKAAPEAPHRTVICANDKARVHVEAAPGVYLVGYRKDRLEQEIQERVDAKRVLNTSEGGNHEYQVTVTVTCLKNGNAIGRFLSGKLGEIDIDSIVRLYDPTAGQQLNEFGIRQNFTQGGFSGAATTLRDAESAFADGVAVALTGQRTVQTVSNR